MLDKKRRVGRDNLLAGKLSYMPPLGSSKANLGFPTDFTIGSRNLRHEKTQYTKFPEHNAVRVSGSAQRRHFVETAQEHSYALIDVLIDGPIAITAVMPRNSS